MGAVTTWVRIRPWFEVALVVLAALGVALLAVTVQGPGGPPGVDVSIRTAVLAQRSGASTDAARAASLIGSELALLAMTAVIAALLVLRRRSGPAAVLVSGMAGATVLTFAIKQLVGRDRPDPGLVLGPVDHSSSFPSGHTVGTTVLVVLVAWLIWPHLHTVRARVLVVAAAATVALAVGASRVYLGYHWPSDVAAAWLLAIGWLAVLRFCGTLLARARHPSSELAPPHPAPRSTVGS